MLAAIGKAKGVAFPLRAEAQNAKLNPRRVNEFDVGIVFVEIGHLAVAALDVGPAEVSLFDREFSRKFIRFLDDFVAGRARDLFVVTGKKRSGQGERYNGSSSATLALKEGRRLQNILPHGRFRGETLDPMEVA